MKADGIEYDERMELLDEVTWPKPLDELLEHAYEIYRRSHPWVAEDALSPKSVVRDMYERAMTFGEYVAFYGLTRSEGLVLRYLSDAYRALRQTVPDSVAHRGARRPHRVARARRAPDRLEPARRVGGAQRPRPARRRGRPTTCCRRRRTLTANERAFTVLVRNAMFRRVELAALAAGSSSASSTPRPGRDGRRTGARRCDGYFAEHDAIDTGPDARGPRMLLRREARAGIWQVRQIVDDPDGDHDWGITATVDLAASDDEGELVLDVTDLVQLCGQSDHPVRCGRASERQRAISRALPRPLVVGGG